MSKNDLKILAVIAVAALLNGCAIGYQVRDVPPAEPLGFTLVDRTPATEKAEKLVEYAIGSCGYGIRQLGDESFKPKGRVAYLGARLQKELGGRLAGRTVEVRHFTVHLNQQVATRNYSASQGIIGALIVSGGCVADETMPGGYAIGVNPEQQPAYVLDLDFSVDGKKQEIKIVEATGSRRILDPVITSHVELANKTFNNSLDTLFREIAAKLK